MASGVNLDKVICRVLEDNFRVPEEEIESDSILIYL